MTLKKAIEKIDYNSNWVIYAEFPFVAGSEARYGQLHFENGGLLDDKKPFANGVEIQDYLSSQIDSELGEEDYQLEIAIEHLIDNYSDIFPAKVAS